MVHCQIFRITTWQSPLNREGTTCPPPWNLEQLCGFGPWSGPMREGFSRYIGPGPGKPRRGPWISEGHHSRSHWRIILMFSCFCFYLYFQLKSSILRKDSFCPRGPKAVMFRLAKFLLETLPVVTYFIIHFFHLWQYLYPSHNKWETHKHNLRLPWSTWIVIKRCVLVCM